MKDISETKAWLISVLLAFVVAFLMCGCRTIRYVPVEKEVHDTTSYAHWDSIVNERVRYVKDSLMSFHFEYEEKSTKDSTYVRDDVKTRVDQDGRVTGRDSTHIEIRYIENAINKRLKDSLRVYVAMGDSIKMYRLRVDSLETYISVLENNQYVKDEPSKWNMFYMYIGKFVSLSVLVILLSIILYIILRYISKGLS